MTTSEVVLEASGVCKAFQDRQVLRDISFQVERGESVAVLGRNGAGKSTLMRIISGILPPNAGSVDRPARIGALIELGAGFHPDLSAVKNLRQAFQLQGVGREEIDSCVSKALSYSGLGDEHLSKPLRHFSSGMVARLGFAFVVALEPELLVSDEVLAVGDDAFQRKCVAWLEEYVDGGGTLLLVSHNLYHVKKLCERALWLNDGEIAADGPAFEVCDAYLASHTNEPVADNTALQVLDADGNPVTSARQGTRLQLATPGDAASWTLYTLVGEVIAHGQCVDGEPVVLPTENLLPGRYRVGIDSAPAAIGFRVGGASRLFGCVDISRRWI